jgi:hypothetical protein
MFQVATARGAAATKRTRLGLVITQMSATRWASTTPQKMLTRPVRKLPGMEDPEVYLRALTAPLARAQEGSALPVVRFSLEAVANAFVILGLLPAARAEEILTAQRRVLESAGFRVGLEIGELSVSPGARGLQEARAPRGSLQRIPLATGAGPVRCRLRGHDLAITWVTLTPEGIRVRYHGDARDSDRHGVRALGEEITEEITELLITDDSGGMYLAPWGKVHSIVSGRRSPPGGTLWIPEGEFLAVPAAGDAGSRGRPPIRWLEFSAGSGQPVRVEVLPPAAVPTDATQPPWSTAAESYLAQLAPPAPDWSLGSFATGAVQLDTAGIVAAVADALLAVGALPPDSAVLTGLPGSVRGDWRLALSDRQLALMDAWAAPRRSSSAGLAVRLPFEQATAVIENITAREDMVSVQLYGHPWVSRETWPMITPCFRVTAVDDTGVEHEGGPASESASPGHEGSGSFWFWPPVGPQAKQLRVIVSTLWEAAWALIDIPGR